MIEEKGTNAGPMTTAEPVSVTVGWMLRNANGSVEATTDETRAKLWVEYGWEVFPVPAALSPNQPPLRWRRGARRRDWLHLFRRQDVATRIIRSLAQHYQGRRKP